MALAASVRSTVRTDAAPVANMLAAPTVNMIAAPAVSSTLDTLSQDTISFGQDADELPQGDLPVTPAAKDPREINEEQYLESFEDSSTSDMIDPALMASTHVAHGFHDNDGDTRYQQVPASSLVSPPESSNDDIGNSPTAAEPAFITSTPHSRHTSEQPQEHFQRYTPESGTIRRESHSSCGDGSVKKEQLHSQSRVSASAQVADEESLKLIKELQAQDLGLRRRGRA